MLQLQLVDMDSTIGPIEVRPFVPLDTEQVDLPMLLKAGSIVAYDSKVWHRGGANVGNTPRPVLYTTWMAADDGLLPRNMGYTIAHAEMGERGYKSVKANRSRPVTLVQQAGFNRCP